MSHDFIHTYFTQAIVEQGVAGYNIINTPVYAALFAIAVIGAYKLLNRLDIKIDKRFVLGIFPFIVLGSVLRVVRDSGAVPSPLLVSPLIYFVVFAIATASLLVSVGIARMFSGRGKGKDGVIHKTEGATPSSLANRGVSYHIIWSVLGLLSLAIAGAFLLPLGVKNWQAVGYIAGITALWLIAILGIYRWHAFKWLTVENAGLLAAHLFDASTTYVALQFFAGSGYYEQHVVSNLIIGVLGPAGQFVLKLAVVPLVLYMLDKELPTGLAGVRAKQEAGEKPGAKVVVIDSKAAGAAHPEAGAMAAAERNARLRSFLKIAILILGLAPGLRNGLRLALGV
jgi:uncharacterized membrane protein